MMIENKNSRDCGFYKEKIIDRYNKTNTDQTTQLFKEIFGEKENKTENSCEIKN